MAPRWPGSGLYVAVDSDGGDVLGDGGFVHIWRLDGNGEWRIDRELWFDAVLLFE